MGKRIATALLAVLTAAAFTVAPAAEPAYPDESMELLQLDQELPEALEVIAFSGESLPAKSSILMDQQTGMVLHESNADEPLPPASVTKIMTLLLVMEAIDGGRITLEEMVSTSENANSMGGSQIWLMPGEEMSVDDMLKAVAISSANDASVALGEHLAGSEEAFIGMMNARAAELGMKNTTFRNCTGLDEEGHLTTARDIAIMSRELMKHEKIKDYTTIWMDSLRGGETELVNTNRLVRFYGGTTGLKTGTTSGAGSCLSATAERDGLGLVAVVMGCPTSDDRFASARSLLDFGFANYTTVEAPSIDSQLVPVKVLHGETNTVTVTYESPGTFVVEKQKEDSILQEITLSEDVQAPVEAGQVLGKAQVVIDGKMVAEYDLRAAHDVGKMTLSKAYGKLLKSLFTLAAAKDAAPEESGEAQTADEGQSLQEPDEAAPQEEPDAASTALCDCGEECYCAQIGDICGCTREE